MLSKGNWIRIECCSGLYHFEYNGTYDEASEHQTCSQMINYAKELGWKKIKKDVWHCPKCVEELKNKR